jgi:Cu-Zn family superoxide dismutase
MNKLVAALPISLLAACASLPDSRPLAIGQADLQRADGTNIGVAVLSEAGGQTRLTISTLGLAPGLHGVHFHTVGKCEAPDFVSAGPHLNPHGKQHGTANPAGSHFGDLPNLSVNEAGLGNAATALDAVSAELLAQVFDADSTALVIHAAADDERTDPSGNSGARIACGVFERFAG